MNVSRKILAPTLPPVFLHRERLSQILGGALALNMDAGAPAPYRLVLLCAPAGYGKTTLLVDTIRHLSLPCCWYTLDRSDQQCSTFLTTLLASIRKAFPHVDPRLDTELENNNIQDEISFKRVMDVLIDALETTATERWILVLCNYQEVSDSPLVKKVMNQLLKRLPPQCLLVIESRALPDLELASLIVYHQVFGLGR